MEIKIVKTISFYNVKYSGCDYEIEEERGEGDEKMYRAVKKDGTTMTNTEVDSLIEQFKMEQ